MTFYVSLYLYTSIVFRAETERQSIMCKERKRLYKNIDRTTENNIFTFTRISGRSTSTPISSSVSLMKKMIKIMIMTLTEILTKI